jgi:hypothetical protein
MVRGPNSDNGTQSPVYYLGSTGLGPPRPRPSALGEVDPPARDAMNIEPDRRTDEGWGGAGRDMAAVAAAGGALGDSAGYRVPRCDGAGSASAKSGQFPVALAEAFAAEFGRVYLNFNPQDQGLREQQLAAFVAAQPDLGWNGAGQLILQSELVAGIAVQGSAARCRDVARLGQWPAHDGTVRGDHPVALPSDSGQRHMAAPQPGRA